MVNHGAAQRSFDLGGLFHAKAPQKTTSTRLNCFNTLKNFLLMIRMSEKNQSTNLCANENCADCFRYSARPLNPNDFFFQNITSLCFLGT